MSIEKYALTVGINQYAESRYDLSGCVNDATDWARLLTAQGYHVLTLVDSDATRANVLEALTGLVSRLEYQDRLVFQFSGHGTYRPDYQGDEPDGKDEALVMYNMDLILDDDLYPILESRKYGSRAVTLSDSCHSGSVNRFVNLDSEIVQGTPKFISPVALDLMDEKEEEAIEKMVVNKGISRNAGVLMSGSADNEYSYDAWFNNRPNGAFTRAAIDTFLPEISYTEWHERIRGILPNEQHPQSPQLGATSHQSRNWDALD